MYLAQMEEEMTVTLADLTRQVARLVTRTVIGATTSAPSNATQLIDTVNLAGFPDNNFVGGTAWITSGVNAGRSRVVTAFSDSADRLTTAAFPSNIASGISFEVAASDFVEYRDLRQAVALALREIGKIESRDDTVAIVDGQLIYDLPTGVAHVTDVYVLEDPGDDDEKPKINHHWEEVSGQLVFEECHEPGTLYGTKIRIVYEHFHSELVGDTDALDDQVDEEYLVYLAARQAMRLAYKRFGKAGSDTIPEWLNEAIEESKKHIRANRNKPRIRMRTA
jgi:hypothetical protein